jgi:hypothetical protein
LAVHIERIVTGRKKQADMLMEEEETIIKMQKKKAYVVSQLVEALPYKLGGGGFDS